MTQSVADPPDRARGAAPAPSGRGRSGGAGPRLQTAHRRIAARVMLLATPSADLEALITPAVSLARRGRDSPAAGVARLGDVASSTADATPGARPGSADSQPSPLA